jgi:hypothetical protein
MGPEQRYRDDPSQYEGEDTRLTSTKELSGWYAYGFAAEVFVICGIGELRCFQYCTSSRERFMWQSRRFKQLHYLHQGIGAMK